MIFFRIRKEDISAGNFASILFHRTSQNPTHHVVLFTINATVYVVERFSA